MSDSGRPMGDCYRHVTRHECDVCTLREGLRLLLAERDYLAQVLAEETGIVAVRHDAKELAIVLLNKVKP